jgi:outer membrane lipoprotein-sorting protein
MKLLCLAGLAWLVAFVVACGGNGNAADGADAQEILSKSAARFDSVKTFHYKLTHEKGSIPIVLNLRLVSAEGDVIVPDRVTADVEAKAGPTTVRVKVVGVGDKTWITNPFTREFQAAPGNAAIGDIIDPVGLVKAVASSIEAPEIRGTETVDGVTTYHISGSLPSDALVDSLSFADAGRDLTVDAWVGKEDSLLRRARLRGPLLPDEDENVVREISLSKFDVPVTIEAPQ